MKKVYDYLNYRDYLKDFYDFEKKRNKAFSLRYFALKAGYPPSAANIFIMVKNGKRNLSNDYLTKFIRGLGLKGKESDFFELLVRFNQTKTINEKNAYYVKLMNFRAPQHKKIEQDQYEFFSKWYYTVIHVLLGISPQIKSQLNISAFSNRLSPSITKEQAKQAFELLERLGLIHIDKKGYLCQLDPVLTTGEEISSIQIANFQKEMIRLGLEAIERHHYKKRDVSTITISLSDNGFNKIKEKVLEFRKELLEIARTDKNESEVYQCNIQFFPLTK